MPSFAASRTRSMPSSSTSSAEYMRADRLLEDVSSAERTFTSGCASISRASRRALGVEDAARFGAPSPAMSAMIFCRRGLRNDLLAQAVGRLARRADDGAPLALEPAQERVRQAADEHVVVVDAVALGPLAREERLHVDRLARAQRDVAVVREELRRPCGSCPATRADRRARRTRCASPRRRASTTRTPAARAGSARSLGAAPRGASRRKRSPSMRPRDARLRGGSAAASGRAPRTRPLETARRRSSASPSRRARASALSHPRPIGSRTQSPRSFAKRTCGKLVALGQVVEREEVDERQVAQDVDDRAARVGVAHRPASTPRRPRCARRSDGRSTRAAGSARTRRAGERAPRPAAGGRARTRCSYRVRSPRPSARSTITSDHP